MKERNQKRKLFLGLFAAVIMVAGITGGVIWAQEGDSPDDPARQSMASRVAEILGLGEDEVTDAFKQAAREMRDERFQNRMARLVEKGQITEDEAAESVDWYQSRPEDIGPGPRGPRLKGRGHPRPGSSFGLRGRGGAGRFAPNGS